MIRKKYKIVEKNVRNFVEEQEELKNCLELQTQIINLRSNADRIIKLINYYFN